MSESVIDKQIVLSLNAHWGAIGLRTVRQAIISLCGGDDTPPALALDIEMDENGKLINAVPTKWEDWINLPVRAQDLSIQVKDGRIRAPTVIVNANYAKIPMKRPKLTSRTIMERDGFTCQYTGRRLSKSQLNIDHVVPKDRGGKDDWTNLVTCDKQLNSKKSNRLNHEIGIKLIRQPKAPPAVPSTFTFKHALHPTHAPFIHS